MASLKIHLFKKFAIAAGSPNNYYLNPSENLWKVASKWSAVEHENVINLTIHMIGFGDRSFEDPLYISMKERFININVGKDGYKKPAGYADNNGLKHFSIEMNPKFLKMGVKGDDIKGWEGISRLYISKLNDEEIKNYAEKMHISKLTHEEIKNCAERKNDPKPKAEEKSKGPYTVTISTY